MPITFITASAQEAVAATAPSQRADSGHPAGIPGPAPLSVGLADGNYLGFG